MGGGKSKESIHPTFQKLVKNGYKDNGSCVVNVWRLKSKNELGHVSLTLKPKGRKEMYVSFWPKGSVKYVKGIVLNMKVKGEMHESLKRDCRENERIPEHFELKTLEVDKMYDCAVGMMKKVDTGEIQFLPLGACNTVGNAVSNWVKGSMGHNCCTFSSVILGVGGMVFQRPNWFEARAKMNRDRPRMPGGGNFWTLIIQGVIDLWVQEKAIEMANAVNFACPEGIRNAVLGYLEWEKKYLKYQEEDKEEE